MRKVLEDLVFLGAAEDVIKAFGKSWKMRTLTTNEHLDAVNGTVEYDTLTRLYALKMYILSKSLTSIDDVLLNDQAETLEFVKKLQPIVVNRLYDEYEKLQNKQADSLKDLDELKN